MGIKMKSILILISNKNIKFAAENKRQVMEIHIYGRDTEQGLYTKADVLADTDEAIAMLSTALLDLCALNQLDALELLKYIMTQEIK